MTTTISEFRSLITPVFVLFSGVALVFLAAMILRDPSHFGSSVMVPPSFMSESEETENRSDVANTPVPITSASTQLVSTEDHLVKNMEFFDSRFERFTADLMVAEEKALSRSDLVGTRFELQSLLDQLERLRSLATTWGDHNAVLLTDSTGQQIAAEPDLMNDYMQLADRKRLSLRDVEELTERLEPLSGFIAMIEDQDKVPYEPGERFQSRLLFMTGNIAEAVREYEDSLAELRRLMRGSRSVDASDEILQDAIYRWRREQKTNAKKSASTVPAYDWPRESQNEEAPPQKLPPEPNSLPFEPSSDETTVANQNDRRANAAFTGTPVRTVPQKNPGASVWTTTVRANARPTNVVDSHTSCQSRTRCRCSRSCPCKARRNTVHYHVVCRH